MRLFTLSFILFAALAKSARGAALALIAVALLATPTQATTIFFLDDFESDTFGGNPAIDLSDGDVGSSWDNEASPGVTVAANPNTTGTRRRRFSSYTTKARWTGTSAPGSSLMERRSRRISTLD